MWPSAIKCGMRNMDPRSMTRLKSSRFHFEKGFLNTGQANIVPASTIGRVLVESVHYLDFHELFFHSCPDLAAKSIIICRAMKDPKMFHHVWTIVLHMFFGYSIAQSACIGSQHHPLCYGQHRPREH